MMKNKILYYLNRLEYHLGCQIPTRGNDFLRITNHLSEFSTSDEQEVARQNLGIPDIVEELNKKIDNKVVEQGDVSWDLEPTEGNTDKILSSHSLYTALLNYVSKTEFDLKIQQLWTKTVNKTSELYDKIEIELNQLDENLRNALNEIKCNFNNYTVHINLEFNLFKNTITEKYDQLTNMYNELLRHFAELKEFVRNEYTNLYNSLYCNINKNEVEPLEKKIELLLLIVNTFLKTSGGTALTNLFGDNEYIGVNQKTLTLALNRIWNKIESLTGEISNGINMIINPTYFVGNETNVNIAATTCQEGEIFEHIAFYANSVLIDEAENVRVFNVSTQINETTEIRCVAKIMGIEYEKIKIITQYNDFFLFSGNFNDSEYAVNYALNHTEYSLPIENDTLRGSYDLTCEDNDNIMILIGKSLEDKFIRADLNGLEIPFEREAITVNGNEYILFTSTNLYNAGTYNIDING